MNESIPLHFSDDSTGQAERSDAVANRQHLLSVTRRLFAEHGPEAVSMSDVVKVAEVGRGTLYRHFPNKGELCLAVMDEELVEFQNEVLASLRALTAVSTPAMTQLDDFLDRLVQFTETYSPLLLETQRFIEKQEGTPKAWNRITVLGLLETAVSQQEIPSDLDLDYLADAILAPLNAQLFHHQRTVQGFSTERISAGLRAFVTQMKTA